MHVRQLKHSLALNFALVALVPIFLLSFIVLAHLARDANKEAREMNTLIARTVSGQVEIFLHEPLFVLQNISAVLEANGSWDAGQVRQVLDLHIRNSDLFEAIFLLTEQGIVDNVGLPEGMTDFYQDFIDVNLAHLPFYSTTVKTKEPTWSDTFLSVMSGNMSIALCVPVGGRALIGHLNLKFLSRFVGNLNSEKYLQVALVDRSGTFFVHPDPFVGETRVSVSNLPIVRDGLAGIEETARYEFNNTSYIGSVQKISGPQWLVLVSQTTGEAYHRVSASALTFLVVAFAGTIMAILFAMIKARRITGPISEAASHARLIAGGEYNVAISESPYDEIRELTGSIQEMAGAVRNREAELQMSQKRFREIYNTTSEGIFIRDTQTQRLVEANRAMTDMFGYSLDELRGLSISELSVGDPALIEKRARELFEKALQGGQQFFEWNYRRKNGETFWAEVTLKRAELDGKERILGVIRDIAERKTLERQLVQAQKMEAIGTLAGGIAHDFNNILTPIMGYVELSMLHLDNPDRMRDDLQEVLQAVQRAKELVRQILTFSRQEEQQLSPTNVAIIIKEALKLLRSSIPTTIEIRQNISPQCGLVMANPTQIHQILMNLCTNAYHAMREKGGVLGVTLAPVRITPYGTIALKELPEGTYLQLGVSDTGHGMSRETMGRILEPYFTTKKVEEGTGLGLSVVHGIAKSLGGDVTVASEEGKGTTFHVYFPVIEGDSEKIARFRSDPPTGGAESIFLVDDEDVILRVQAEMLDGLGYRVKTFTSPNDALQVFLLKPELCDLVITDMTMPKMTGDILARKMREQKPGLPVILCTGFSEIINREKALEMGMDDFLVKPVELHELARSVRRVLDRRPTNPESRPA